VGAYGAAGAFAASKPVTKVRRGERAGGAALIPPHFAECTGGATQALSWLRLLVASRGERYCPAALLTAQHPARALSPRPSHQTPRLTKPLPKPPTVHRHQPGHGQEHRRPVPRPHQHYVIRRWKPRQHRV
jgi:hypothetical protein